MLLFSDPCRFIFDVLISQHFRDRLFIHQAILSFSTHLSCLSISLSLSLSLSLFIISVFLSFCLYFPPSSRYFSVFLCSLCISLFRSVFISFSMYFSLSLFLSAFLSFSLYFSLIIPVSLYHCTCIHRPTPHTHPLYVPIAHSLPLSPLFSPQLFLSLFLSLPQLFSLSFLFLTYICPSVCKSLSFLSLSLNFIHQLLVINFY